MSDAACKKRSVVISYNHAHGRIINFFKCGRKDGTRVQSSQCGRTYSSLRCSVLLWLNGLIFSLWSRFNFTLTSMNIHEVLRGFPLSNIIQSTLWHSTNEYKKIIIFLIVLKYRRIKKLISVSKHKVKFFYCQQMDTCFQLSLAIFPH